MSVYEDIVTLIESDRDAESDLPSLLVDGLLDARIGSVVPLSRYLDEDRVARVLVEELQVLLNRPEFRDRVQTIARDSFDETDLARTELRSLLPDVLVESLNEFVTRDYRADPQLVRSLVDHPAMRTVMRNVLEETLRSFVERLSEWIRESDTVPGMSGAWSLFTGFFGMAHRYTRRFASRLEERIQEQVDRFVEEMIGEVLEKLVEELCSEGVRQDLAAWRGQALDVVLDRSIQSYLEGLEEGADSSDRAIERLLEQLAQGEEMSELLRAFVSMVLRTLKEQRIRDVLKLLGVEQRVQARVKQTVENLLFENSGSTNRGS